MSLRTDWHYTASMFICWGQAVAFAPGDRVPDEFIYAGRVPLSAVTFDPSDSPSWDSLSARTWESLLCTWGIGLDGGQTNQFAGTTGLAGYTWASLSRRTWGSLHTWSRP